MKHIIHVRGVPTHHRQHIGADPAATPLLFVHGLACASDAAVPLLAHFVVTDERRSAFVADMPGYGETPRAATWLDIEEMAAWQVDYMDTLGLARVHVMGHSMGGQVALAMARLVPDRVVSLTLVGSTTGDQIQPAWRYVLGLLADSVFESLVWNLALMRMYYQMGVRGYVATMLHMLREHPIARAEQVRCPALVIRGSRDTIIQKSMALELAAALPFGVYDEVPGGAHAVPFNLPAETWALAGPFAGHSER